MDNAPQSVNNVAEPQNVKYCKHCGAQIPAVAVICTHCGCQVEDIKKSEQASIVINNANNNTNANTNVNGAMFGIYPKNKWVAFFLCLFFGYIGVHKFYEGRTGLGVLYFFTLGLFGFGWLIDCIILLCKPNPYFVH